MASVKRESCQGGRIQVTDVQWFSRKYSAGDSALAMDANGSLLPPSTWFRGLEMAAAPTVGRGASRVFSLPALALLYLSVCSCRLFARAWRNAWE